MLRKMYTLLQEINAPTKDSMRFDTTFCVDPVSDANDSFFI